MLGWIRDYVSLPLCGSLSLHSLFGCWHGQGGRVRYLLQVFCSSHNAIPKTKSKLSTPVATTSCWQRKAFSKHESNIKHILPAVHRSMCKCKWLQGILSATGCPHGTFFHHHSRWTHLWSITSVFQVNKCRKRHFPVLILPNVYMQHYFCIGNDWSFKRLISACLRGSHLNSPLPLPRQVQLIMWPFSACRSHLSPMR